MGVIEMVVIIATLIAVFWIPLLAKFAVWVEYKLKKLVSYRIN